MPNPLISRVKRILVKPKVRLLVLSIMHATLFAGILWSAFLLRFDFDVPSHMVDRFWTCLSLVVLAKMAVFYYAGHFHGWYRYVTFSDLVALVKAGLIASAGFAAINLVFFYAAVVPRSVILLDFLLTVLCVGTLRSLWRLYDEHFNSHDDRFESALMICKTGHDARLAHQVNTQLNLGVRVRALVAPGEHRKGARLGHLRIAGTIDQLPSIVRKYKATTILVPSDVLSGPELRELMEKCNERNLELRVLPQLDEVLRGAKKIPLRELNIADLLRRDSIQLDADRIGNALRGKRILVTGAGGSIGSEICRQLLQFEPAEIVLLGRGENRIFSVNLELRKKCGATKLTPSIVDVTDRVSMQQVFDDHRPHVVFHAAAHKHVFLMEHHVAEAIENNAQGTRVVADLAVKFGAERFVMVSTDKAVNPTSVMGCSKQLAERVVQARSKRSKTLFCVVRFGNVLGSNGSVIPIFQEQIRNGGPITVTDPNMTRFFMSIPEASQLVLQAGSMCKGGEVFCLDMGEPIKIVDLANDLIRLSGLPPESIDIQFVGARTGEKLYEELYFSEETTIPTEHEKVRAARQRPDIIDIDAVVDRFLSLRGKIENEDFKDLLKQVIPEYQRPDRVHKRSAVRKPALNLIRPRPRTVSNPVSA